MSRLAQSTLPRPRAGPAPALHKLVERCVHAEVRRGLALIVVLTDLE